MCIHPCDNCRSFAAELAANGQPYNVQYYFSWKTSNTPLRHHIEVRHALFYLEQAEKHGWAINVKFANAAFGSGYTFKTLKQVITQPGVKLGALPPPPPSDPSDCLPAGIIASQQPMFSAGLPPFTIDELRNYLVCFIATNDLVHITPQLFCSHIQPTTDIVRQLTRLNPLNFANLFSFAAPVT